MFRLSAVLGSLVSAVASPPGAVGTIPVTESATAAAAPDAPAASAPDIVVTARRTRAAASTASEGAITADEVRLRPIYRSAQVLETVPGLVVTQHSGEGKASQYLLRGFNLDHGTDFASFVDGMPINRPTNAHGQGYSDQNFIMPLLLAGLDYSKGPYHADLGDFSAVGAARMRLADSLPTTLAVSAGTLGDYGMSSATTVKLGDDRRLLLAGEYAHIDGPWTNPDDFAKVNVAARYSVGGENNGYSLTALYYRSNGNLTTDQPLRAVQEGLIDRFGTLDPTDGSRSNRFSLSANLTKPVAGGTVNAGTYYIRSGMTLWNDFTHLLDDPVNGDQEEQVETRTTVGGQVAWRRTAMLGRVRSVTTLGVQGRYDTIDVSRLHTAARVPLATCSVEGIDPVVQVPAPGGRCSDDAVTLIDLGGYVENTTFWTPWLRSTVGLREEYYRATDRSRVASFTGEADQTLFQPKVSLAVGPVALTELYLSAGRGFHSDDARGVLGTVPLQGLPGQDGRTPLLARADGYEIGLRTDSIPRLHLEAALFQQDFESELAYDQDIGQDSASAPSRRQGVELSAQYRPTRWLELTGDLALARARYRGDLGVFGLASPFIANAPRSTLALGALVNDFGRWFGGAQLRGLGSYPLKDGPANPRDPGYTELNLDIGRHVGKHLGVEVGVFNLFNTHANASAYYYTTRLAGEPASGVAGYQVHPLEPRSARATLTTTF